MRTELKRHIEAYLHGLELRNYSPDSIRTYRDRLRGLVLFMEQQGLERFQDVTEHHLVRYRIGLHERGLAPVTVHNCVVAAARLFAWLTQQGKLLLDPAELLELKPPHPPLLDVPSEDEIELLLAQPNINRPIGLRDRAVLEVLYGSALRRSELCAMSVRDVDVKAKRIRVMGKGRKERVVPLSTQAVRWLDLYVEHARYTFKAPQSEQALWLGIWHEPLDKAGITQLVEAYRKRAGIRTQITPHALRRACATHMLAHGAHPVAVQHLLGHASLRHLGRYLKVTILDLHQTHSRSKPGR